MKLLPTLATLLLAGTSLSQTRSVNPGSPLPGITPAELELFRAGLRDFTEVETPDDGLGPAFNGNSCAVCHSAPAIGGISTVSEVRAGYRDENGKFEAIGGGTLYHLFSTPPHRCQVQVPSRANVVARRVPLPLFGAGMIEAIDDATIVALEDPDDRDGDGIRGRAARVTDIATGRQRIGRFGWKAQHAGLLSFSGDAYRNEMGITNDLFPDEEAMGFTPAQLKLCGAKGHIDDSRDRATGLRGIDKFELFMKFLAPLGRGTVNDAALAGEKFFASLGCASCHVPVLTTAPNANPVFDRKAVPLFSDLLLHDVATGDGIEQASAAADQLRTPPLWGLRFRRPLLHDGSAANPEAAILRHGNEAANAAAAYRALAPDLQRQLLAFLDTL